MPRSPRFGLAIDPVPGYDGASRCDPSPKPGVVAFQHLILAAYPGTGAGSISRACSGSASSEHNEGRAWDWGVNASVPVQKAKAEAVIDWLAAPDRYDNPHAMARRLGIMYLIWNRRIWFPWSGWSVYCKQRGNVCRDPSSGEPRSPHRDHVHFSFTWAGARKQTSFWHRDRSLVSGIDEAAAGYWVLGRNGGVYPQDGAYFYGSRADHFESKPYVAIASTPSGYGYFIVRSDGVVRAFGDADKRGDAHDERTHIADIETTPDGRGYWLVSDKGRVFNYGRARDYGNARDRDVEIVAMASTDSGRGYWLLTARGKVLAFGDASGFGDLQGDDEAVDLYPTPSGRGYWIVTESGKVSAFGDAPQLGDAAPATSEVGLSATGSGGVPDRRRARPRPQLRRCPLDLCRSTRSPSASSSFSM
ncbi:MAG TPA: hypothetical protein VFK89_08465 [Actinomycetota bacterium]|nr:hypothetical protein [Actinomycetota bacterium]